MHNRLWELTLEMYKNKFLYYEGVKYGFTPISDEAYDKIETEYKSLCEELGVEPRAYNMVGYNKEVVGYIAPWVEAIAMRESNKELYEKIKRVLFTFR